jgi:hypothetical protein
VGDAVGVELAATLDNGHKSRCVSCDGGSNHFSIQGGNAVDMSCADLVERLLNVRSWPNSEVAERLLFIFAR